MREARANVLRFYCDIIPTTSRLGLCFYFLPYVHSKNRVSLVAVDGVLAAVL